MREYRLALLRATLEPLAQFAAIIAMGAAMLALVFVC